MEMASNDTYRVPSATSPAHSATPVPGEAKLDGASGEQRRVVAEEKREVAEEHREAAEVARHTDESLRQVAESVRRDAEATRLAAEETRSAAEQARRNAEHVREAAGGVRAAVASALGARDDLVAAAATLREGLADQQRQLDELRAKTADKQTPIVTPDPKPDA